jgi:hypothetical protein
MPDVALFVSCVVLFYCLFFYNGTEQLFRDSDTGWHIRNGESILATGVIPHADPYSFTKPGAPWFPWEWGADVVMGYVHKQSGLSGIALLYASLIAAATWLWFQLHWQLHGNFLFACALAAPMLSTTNLHWLARPHLFSWVFLLILLLKLETAGTRFRWRDAIGLAALCAVWANMHGSFFLAPIVALIYWAGLAARRLIWNAGGENRPHWYLLAALSLAAGSLANPFGVALHIHIYKYLNDMELLQRIGEFQSFNFHVEGAFQIVLTMGIAALGGFAALSTRKPHHFLLAAVFCAMALRSARGLPLVALLLLPAANSALIEALRRARGLRPWLRGAIDTFLGYGERLRAIDAGFRGYALIPVVLLLTYIILRAPAVQARTGFPPTEFPVAAAAEIEKLPETARILAPDKFGGYLIYRFAGKRKVFFDGRSDFYGSKFMMEYIKLVEVRPGWQEQIDKWKFTHALLPNAYSLIPALEQAGWKRLYRDATVTLLIRN